MLVILFVGCSKSNDQESENAAYFGMNSPEEFVYDRELADTLAQKGFEVSKIPRTERFNPCWDRVWRALKRTFGNEIESTTVGSEYAYMFADWANESSKRLFDTFKLKKMPLRGTDIPKGSVVVWPRGSCGYSRNGGHIEIVVSPGRACSFICGAICTSDEPYVYVPVKRNSHHQALPSDVAFKSEQPDLFSDPSLPANMDTGSAFFPGKQSPDFGSPAVSNAPFDNSAEAYSNDNSILVDNGGPASGPDHQCKYGRTTLGYCNISPNFNPFQSGVTF
jgi:hypothetical protein